MTFIVVSSLSLVSLFPQLSLSLLWFLPLYLAHSFSSTLYDKKVTIKTVSSLVVDTRCLAKFKGGRSCRVQLSRRPDADVEQGVGACGCRSSTTVEWQSPAIFHSRARYQKIPLDLLVIMVLSVHEKSARIINTLFCAEMTNFTS